MGPRRFPPPGPGLGRGGAGAAEAQAAEAQAAEAQAAEAQAAEAQAEPGTDPAYVTARRRTRVSRALLLCILCLQAVLSLRLHNTAFEDEALYVYSGHMELEHLLHGAALQGSYAAYFSGSPVLYPLAAGFLNALGGLTAARMLSLVEMLSITALLYSLSRRLFNERIALTAAMLFSVCESAIFLGNFATYDATCMFLLACAAWIVVRTAGCRWPVFLVAAPVAALAVGVKSRPAVRAHHRRPARAGRLAPARPQGPALPTCLRPRGRGPALRGAAPGRLGVLDGHARAPPRTASRA